MGLVSDVGDSREQTLFPAGDPPPTTPHFAALHPASLQPAALQTVAASGAGGFCFRAAYYYMYPISTDDLTYARGHYPWTVDGGGSDCDLRPSTGGGL